MTQKKYRKQHHNQFISQVIIYLILMALVSGSLYYVVFRSGLFTVKEIQVEGTHRISGGDIRELSGIQLGEQFYGINLAESAKAIEFHPYVREAALTRKGVSTINIVVREREEYAIIPYMGSYISLDEEKVVLNVSDGILGSNVCLITGIEFINFQTGKEAEVHNKESLHTAYQILEAAREADILDMISEINVDQSGQVKIVTFNGIDALLGYMKNPAYSVLALKEALITLHTRNMNNVIIDMRFDGHITVQEKARQEDEDD